MAFHIKDDFAQGAPVSAVPATWFNAVASFLNNLVGGDGINIIKNAAGASIVELDIDPSSTPAENPGNAKTIIGNSFPGNSAADTAAWTAGGANGLAVTVLSRTRWDGSHLYGYYRTLVFDKYGRLYSVSGETRYTIDTAVTYNP